MVDVTSPSLKQTQIPYKVTEAKQLSHRSKSQPSSPGALASAQDQKRERKLQQSINIRWSTCAKIRNRGRSKAFFSLVLRPTIMSGSHSISISTSEMLYHTHRQHPNNHTTVPSQPLPRSNDSTTTSPPSYEAIKSCFLNISHQFRLSHYTATNLAKTFSMHQGRILHQAGARREPKPKKPKLPQPHIIHTQYKSHQTEATEREKQPPTRNVQVSSKKTPNTNKFPRREVVFSPPFTPVGQAMPCNMQNKNVSILPNRSRVPRST